MYYKKLLTAICLVLAFLASCSTGGRNGKLPKSTGQPYEVVLEGDTDSIVTKMLTEDVTGPVSYTHLTLPTT